MKLFLFNIVLALIWTAVTATFSFGNFLIGLVLAYGVLLLVSPALDDSRYTRRVWKSITLFFYFIKELFVSSVRVAIDVLRPGFKMKSGVVDIPLDVKTDLEITVLANMISLTPGTLSLEVSEDKKDLYIHAMYIDEGVEELRASIKSGMERRILEITR
ncbi:Na+/H+ antiporter subunit E [Balneolaceae bacterium ANBcel3]|nr:Na+/H+ antiporter subunit E [Balneolaceae bacterium ANBcel3]